MIFDPLGTVHRDVPQPPTVETSSFDDRAVVVAVALSTSCAFDFSLFSVSFVNTELQVLPFEGLTARAVQVKPRLTWRRLNL